MNLQTISLDQFLCKGASQYASSNQNSFDNLKPALEPLIGNTIRNLGSGYVLYELGAAGNTALKYNGSFVGLYYDEVLAIETSHQGKFLSVPLVLDAVIHRQLPSKRILSQAGERALVKAWMVANSRIPNPWP
ncbi:hypothetical protein [Inquilinus sp. OTU3971]|uniref:hypothetical protein n=1 Tax=Inquilinus sp. OTU3971 TaxID=3043855 RepID=UPI00313B8268